MELRQFTDKVCEDSSPALLKTVHWQKCILYLYSWSWKNVLILTIKCYNIIWRPIINFIKLICIFAFGLNKNKKKEDLQIDYFSFRYLSKFMYISFRTRIWSYVINQSLSCTRPDKLVYAYSNCTKNAKSMTQLLQWSEKWSLSLTGRNILFLLLHLPVTSNYP